MALAPQPPELFGKAGITITVLGDRDGGISEAFLAYSPLKDDARAAYLLLVSHKPRL